jgi:hypothetical protein
MNSEQGRILYRVLWKGYDESEASWKPASELEYVCFLPTAMAPNTDLIRDAHECLDEYWRSQENHGNASVKFPAVLNAFEEFSVQKELIELKGTLSLQRGQETHLTATADYIDLLLLQSASQNADGALFALTPHLPTDPSTSFEAQFLSMVEVMGNAAYDILPMADRVANLEIVKRASQWALARTFRFLYQWHATIGPALIGPMVKLHASGKKIEHAALAALVSHVLEFARERGKKRSTARTTSEHGHSQIS